MTNTTSSWFDRLDTARQQAKQNICLIATGGTIVKAYNPRDAQLHCDNTIMKEIVTDLRLRNTTVDFKFLMEKDSLDIKSEDRKCIIEEIIERATEYDAIIVTHGTDTLTDTIEELAQQLPSPCIPVLFTGAMVPHKVQQSDAMQNMTEAFLSAQLLSPGYYIVFHGQILRAPGAYKNRDTMTFSQRDNSYQH